MNVDYKIVDKQIILSRKLESIPLAQQQGPYRYKESYWIRTKNR